MVGVASAPPCRWDLEVRAAITLAYGNATAVRDCVSLPPVGPHCLLLSHRAANAAHRGLEQLERVLVGRSAIFLGNSKEAVTLGGDEVQPVVVLLK